MSDARIRGLFAAAVLGMLAYCVTHLELSTDVTNFMPEESHRELAVLASRLADSELTRTMVITVGAARTETAVAAARELAARLEEQPEVAWLRGGLDPGQLEHLYRLYFPRRHRFLSDRPEEEIPARIAPEALRARARAAREALALPASTLSARVLAADPLGAFEGLVARLRAQGPELATHDGHFVTADGRWAVIFLATRGSAFDSGPQARLLGALEEAFREAQARHGADAGLVLEASGANRFAVAAERSIRRDVVVVSAVSFVGVGVVFLAFLRSLHFFLLAIFPALTGILAGATATRAVLGQLDGLTMAFGASLIGVAIDYSIHVIDHHRLEPETPPRETVRRLRPSVVLGAATTMASFAGLGLTSFPGFREIGLFAVTGVGAALAVTLFVLPGFLGAPRDRAIPPLAERTARGLARGVRALAARRRLLVLVPLAAALAMAVFLPRLRFVDDLSRLMATDPALRAEEDRVRKRIARVDDARVVVALGAEPGEAVARNDRVAARLEEARAAGALADFRSLHALLWSEALQERNVRVLRGIPALADRVEAAFVAEGFRPGALDPFRATLEAPPAPPLDAATLRASPLGPLVSPLLLDLGDRTAAVTYLRGVHSPEALSGALEGLEGVHVFDQGSFLNEIYREFRTTTLRQIAVGSLLVVLVLGLRYRRLRPAMAAFLPSVLVAGTLLALFAALGVGINLLHVTSLILVMGMGVDYGIFLVDGADRPRGLEATMLSLLLACLTTVFVFGTLTLSEHPALRAIGLTTGLGILLSFVLAPVTLVLLRRPGSPGDWPVEPAKGEPA